MRDSEIVERLRGHRKTEALVKRDQMTLRPQHDRPDRVIVATQKQCPVHQRASQPSAAQMRGERDPPDADRWRRPGHRRQAEIAAESVPFPQQQMPCGLVEAVEIRIRRSLLDDKDVLAKAQDVIEFRRRQLFKPPPFERDFRRDLWQALSPSIQSRGSAMQPRDYGPFPYTPINDR